MRCDIFVIIGVRLGYILLHFASYKNGGHKRNLMYQGKNHTIHTVAYQRAWVK